MSTTYVPCSIPVAMMIIMISVSMRIYAVVVLVVWWLCGWFWVVAEDVGVCGWFFGLVFLWFRPPPDSGGGPDGRGHGRGGRVLTPVSWTSELALRLGYPNIICVSFVSLIFYGEKEWIRCHQTTVSWSLSSLFV